MASRFSGCEHNLTATIKPIRGNRENGFYKFPDVSFMSPDASRILGMSAKILNSRPTESLNREPLNL